MEDIVRAGNVRPEGISFTEATAPQGNFFETTVELAIAEPAAVGQANTELTSK